MQMAYRVKEEKYAVLKKQNQKAQTDIDTFKKKVKSYKNRKNQDIGNANKEKEEAERQVDDVKLELQMVQEQNQKLKDAMEDLMQKTEAQRHVTIEKNKL